MRRVRRAIGYARVSSTEQAIGTSLQDQQDVIRGHAKRCGLDVAKMYVEAESSTAEKFEKREQIQALMRDLREGDLVIVAKVDRWSRDAEFSYRSIREILAAKASFFAVDDNCDPSTHDGDTMLSFRILFAREEYKRIRQRTTGTRNALSGKGYFAAGHAPYGYKRGTGKGVERNILLVDEDAAAAIRRVFQLCIDGLSLREIGVETGFTDSRVYNILHNRHYIGEMRAIGEPGRPGRRFDGPWIKALHPAIVGMYTWNEAQKSLHRRAIGDRKATKASKTATWWLRDVARCGLCCGKMASSYSSARANRFYFRCWKKCTNRLVRVDWAEDQCDPIVMTHLESLQDQLLSAKRPVLAARPPAQDVELRRAKLNRKRARYVEAFADGAMDREALRTAMAKLDAELAAIEADLYEPDPVPKERAAEVLKIVGTISRAWKMMAATRRRGVVNAIAKSAFLVVRTDPWFDWFSVDEILRRRGDFRAQ